MQQEYADILSKALEQNISSLGLYNAQPPYTTANTYLVNLCKLWGLIKYIHPYISYRNINWDEALLDVLPTFLKPEATSSEYLKGIVQLISHLKDFNTRVYCNQKIVHMNSFDKEKEETQKTTLPQEPLSDTVQPSVERLHGDAVSFVSLTDHKQFEDWGKLKEMTKLFQEVKDTSKAVVFDLRLKDDYFGRGTSNLGSMFQDAIRLFVNDPVVLPTTRQRICNGLVEHQKAHPSITSIFTHGFYTSEADVLYPVPQSSTQPIFMSFIVDKNTPSIIIDIAIAFQVRDLGTIVYTVDEGDYYKYGGGSASVLTFEPGISSTIFPFPSNNLDIKVLIRQNERLNPDSTIGFRPDTILYKKNTNTQTVKEVALEHFLGTGLKSPKTQPHHIYAVRKYEEDLYKDELPPLEVRILSLLRLWTAVNHFYPYKSLLDNEWEFELYNSIEAFKQADTLLQYTKAVAELVSKISDTHAYVRSPILSQYVGTHTPPIRVKTIGENVVVTEILTNSEALSQILLGDVITHIDDVPISTRRETLNKVLSSSTLQSSFWRTDLKLLAGPENSIAKLEIKKVVSRENDKEDSSRSKDTHLNVVVEVPRIVQSHIQSVRKDPPTFSVLEDIDVKGNHISYVDLTRLFFHEVDTALDAIITDNTTSLIVDLRGYTRGTIYRLAPRLSSKKTIIASTEMPLLMPSLLSDDQTHQSAFLRTYQSSFQTHSDDSLSTSQPLKIVALVNEETISHGEYSVAYLKALQSDTILVGKPTSGSVGNITNILLPGGIVVGFTGMAIAHFDGSPIQRCGIRPDILVEERVDRIQDFRDTILEEAISYLKRL